MHADHVILTAGVGALALLIEKVLIYRYIHRQAFYQINDGCRTSFLPCIISHTRDGHFTLAQNEIIAAEDYIDNSDEHHDVCRCTSDFFMIIFQTGKLTIKQVAVGERPMPKDENANY